MILLITTIFLNSFHTMASHQGLLTLALTVVLLALPSLTYGVTLHVRRTSTNTSCLTHPCKTLSEYAQDPGQYFIDSNLTLQFLPGTHTLNVHLTITNIHQLEITNAVVLTKVECNSNVGFTLMNISVVRIEGLAFVGCARFGKVHTPYHNVYLTYYGLHFQSVQMAEIIDCTFQDSYGSALGVVDSQMVLKGSRFLNNCRLCSNESCIYDYQAPRCYGGGVFVQRSNLYITGSSRFSGNSACHGGGVTAWDSSNVYISGSTTFSGNSARYARGGGRVSAVDNSIVNISGNSAYGGGGVSALHSNNVYISGNTTFSGNSAWYGDGGGVSAEYSSIVNISGSTTFSCNSASSDGGGVYAQCSYYSSNVWISGNTTFSSNSASRDGGGVCVRGDNEYNNDGGIVYVYISAIFSGNSAGRNGGGVSARNSFVGITRNSTFTANRAGFKGGCIYVLESSISFSGTGLFSGNVAQLGGGGIYAEDSNLKVSSNLTVGSNTAQLGGGIYSDNNTFSSVGHNVVERNVATYYGGGIFIRRTLFICTGKNTFIANSAEEGRGDICHS